MASFVVKDSASRGEFAIIDCRPDSGGGECASAEYLLGFEIVIIEADDVVNMPRYRACNGSGSGHPPFQWEAIVVGR